VDGRHPAVAESPPIATQFIEDAVMTLVHVAADYWYRSNATLAGVLDASEAAGRIVWGNVSRKTFCAPICLRDAWVTFGGYRCVASA
jgi:hypothetical protein